MSETDSIRKKETGDKENQTSEKSSNNNLNDEQNTPKSNDNKAITEPSNSTNTPSTDDNVAQPKQDTPVPTVEESAEDVDNIKPPEQKSAGNWNHFKSKNQNHKSSIQDKSSNEKSKTPEEKFFDKLSDRFVKQQDQVIDHRKTLLRWFAWITATQLIIINVLIFVCILVNDKIVDTTLDFMKFFVGATFVELLGGLLIIVNYVFSHETSDMLKHLTYVKPPSDK